MGQWIVFGGGVECGAHFSGVMSRNSVTALAYPV